MMAVTMASIPTEQLISALFSWKTFCIILLVINIKNLPLVWHTRVLNALRFILRSERSRTPLTPAHLFQPLITESHGSLMELDYNMHKSNSTYFQDVDIARAHLVCTLFSKGIEQARYGKDHGVIGSGSQNFGMALGAVCCSFRKEINLFENYEMWTRILSWDRKWFYLVTHFVRKDKVRPRRLSLYPRQKNRNAGTRSVDKKEDAIVASALSKIVFKKGRLTVPPDLMLQASGLLPPRPADVEVLQTPLASAPRQESMSQKFCNIPFRFFEKADVLYEAARNSLFPDPDEKDQDRSRGGSPDGTGANPKDLTWAKVEEERVRGLEIASKLAGLEGLAGEFTAEADALGKHSDLCWVLGLTY